ncbi:cation:proton antiporter [Helicobacter kayseriensis]|uniref:cation:proton antiporter n=1 Tax=Helicobacter kayseriensis TaxID=2905877 RepID=UPI001E3E79F7|nr:cation:proton antiporter [Helicobacter kayseriensis]MCE3046504.1 cation:proton antiporter [Helicobacter kayseriensis]MCE3048193.1 cation:proton antiporter [Helicobacter kayseriensis]
MTITSLAVIVGLIAIAPFLSNLSRFPIVVVEMLLGALATYLGIFEKNEAAHSVAETGFLILMFLCGTEVNLKSFIQLKQEGMLQKIFLYFLILYTLSVLIVLTQKLPLIYIATFPIMGVGMIMALIKEYGKNHIWLNLALKVGVIGELLSICALVTINGLYNHGMSIELLKTFGVLLSFLLVIAFIFQGFKILFWWFPSLKTLIAPHNDSNNQDLRFGAMLFFLFVAIVVFLGLEVALGAFIAGMILATFFSTHHKLHQKLNHIGFGFFIPFFFVHVGTTLDLRSLFSDDQILKNALMIIVGMLSIRLISSFVTFRSFLQTPKNTILYALSDAMPLTFLIAAATLALQLKIITMQGYYSFIVGAMIEGIVFMIMIKIILTFWKTKSTPSPTSNN